MPKRGGSLRIVAGELGGRRIRIPERARPTTERTRGAIFAALQREPPARVLDLFAGSGGLGLEALSRGAQFVRMVEQSDRAAAVIARNAQDLDVSDSVMISVANALSTDLSLGGPYGLVLADPPYEFEDWGRLWVNLLRPEVLAEDAVVVIEHSARVTSPPTPVAWAIWKTRSAGDTAYTFYLRSVSNGVQSMGLQ